MNLLNTLPGKKSVIACSRRFNGGSFSKILKILNFKDTYQSLLLVVYCQNCFNLFQPSVVFHIETSHLIRFAVQLKWLVSIWNATQDEMGKYVFFGAEKSSNFLRKLIRDGNFNQHLF